MCYSRLPIREEIDGAKRYRVAYAAEVELAARLTAEAKQPAAFQTWREWTFEPTKHETLSRASCCPELNGVEPKACRGCGKLVYELYDELCNACCPDEEEFSE